MFSKDTTVKAKLTMAFGGLALLVLVVCGFSIKAMGDAHTSFEDYINGINARATVTAGVRAAIDARAIAVRNLVVVTKPEDIALEKAQVTKAHEEVGIRVEKLVAMGNQPNVPQSIRDMIAEIARVEATYKPVALGIVDLALKGNREEAGLKIVNECRPLLAQLVKVTDDYASITQQRSVQFIADAQANYFAERNWLIAACVLAFVAAAVAGTLITRDLTSALGGEPAELCEVVSHVANGNLTTRLQVRNGDTTSVLAAVDRMQSGLVRIVSTVRQGAESVATASAQIESGNRDLSARTESQASALEETASSMEQLSATVVQNADNAREANQLAQNASHVAAHGGEVVGQFVDTMKGINDSSKKMAEIISVIEGIAFQTNILALNAAVEAARAGEQGRGFAVVASEVRSLAGRSAEAAKEIKGLISASVERVGQGTVLVDQAGTTMNDVVASIKRVTDLMGKISLASNEQASGVAQVGEAVTQMDQATQNNAALVEEMAAAASSLKGQAGELVKAVAVFNIGQSAGSRLMLA